MDMMTRRGFLSHTTAATFGCLLGSGSGRGHLASNEDRIRPYARNPFYWQYNGRPVMLLGGSKDDNLFQLPDLRDHLDEIHAAGGNYVRNTMSDRPDKGFEVYPFKRLPNGKYDLRQWNAEYWRRFENLLRWAKERDIIVQIELWDRFDYSDSGGSDRWKRHPYNPQNNVNYTSEQSGLKTTYKRHPGSNEQPFFFTVPALQNNRTVLQYQIAQVDKLLSISLQYGNVLYCMDNETSGSPEWGKFWANHVRDRARRIGVEVHTTEMWDRWDPKGGKHTETYDHPELYSFVDLSQNNHNKGQRHWDNLQWVRNYIRKRPRPINTVKIYGADTGRFGNSQDAEERFWRNVFGGVAATRFHRPPAGLGFSRLAQAHLRSMRMLLADIDIFRCQPDAEGKQLSNREANEAYLIFEPARQYAVYFPSGGSVDVRLDGGGSFQLRWLDIRKSRWHRGPRLSGNQRARLQSPGDRHWAAVITRL